MRIALGTVVVSDDHRRALAARYGNAGLATREQMRNYILRNGTHALDDLMETTPDDAQNI